MWVVSGESFFASLETRVALIQIGDCVFDKRQYELSHGFESLDPIAQEAFVNHMHLSGDSGTAEADRILASWASEMRARWPGRAFRIYRQVEAYDVTIRFHLVRHGSRNWCEQGIDIITVSS
jgi:hypothetical protein